MVTALVLHERLSIFTRPDGSGGGNTSTVGDDARLANYHMQTIEQDYQQAVSTIAGIMRDTYNAAQSIISNIKG